MRSFLIIMALIGLLPFGTYAKGRTACSAKRTHTTHRTAHHKVVKKVKYNNVAQANIPAADPQAVCYGYRQHNIAVAECPGVFYSRDNAAAYEYSVEGTYLGYYPVRTSAPQTPRQETAPVSPAIAPQSINVSHYRGIAPESGNFCNNCSAQ